MIPAVLIRPSPDPSSGDLLHVVSTLPARGRWAALSGSILPPLFNVPFEKEVV
jgi:hypothetical protein